MIFEGSLDKTDYLPGESLHISYLIENSKQFLIKSIDVSLIQINRIQTNVHLPQFFQTTIPNICNCQDEFVNHTFSIDIPSLSLPPSYRFSNDGEKKTFVNVSYVISVKIQVKELSNDFHFHIPFTLGTDTQLQLYEQLTFNSEESSSLSEDDQPPSYNSIVQYER